MSVFEFPAYDQDFIDKMLRDFGDQIPEEFHPVLQELGILHQTRDDDLEDFLRSDQFAPAIGVELVAAQSVTDSTWTEIIFDTQNFLSTDQMSWAGGTQVTVGEDGVYQAVAVMTFAANTTGERRVRFRVNGSTTTAWVGPTASQAAVTGVGLTRVLSLASGDYVEVQVWQNSGGGLNVTGTLEQAFYGKSS